jgi:hypothetical protein
MTGKGNYVNLPETCLEKFVNLYIFGEFKLFGTDTYLGSKV